MSRIEIYDFTATPRTEIHFEQYETNNFLCIALNHIRLRLKMVHYHSVDGLNFRHNRRIERQAGFIHGLPVPFCSTQLQIQLITSKLDMTVH
jgi:hypothetical protein